MTAEGSGALIIPVLPYMFSFNFTGELTSQANYISCCPAVNVVPFENQPFGSDLPLKLIRNFIHHNSKTV